ncbi:hypothetical protein B0E38_06448 [Streptomyces sp. 111WW2]|uniref:hypothetical protein n=1 Tax=Streptomyces sp. 111WW2 TaxID=1945515 RepID=UPI000D0C7639|nr:hypothetical protein [Streptomyces sp. 111WW2]PSK47971.1 hypothetical protein B0E38_06448 [Streptomyces sp. 111WW2]
MQDGDKLKLRGPAGALFVVTVGQPFTKELIEARIARGEWSYPNGETPAPPKAKAKPAAKAEPTTDPEKEPAPAREPDPDRPAANAPKSEWVVYVARTQHMSREDAANYTKADLIDMVS